jgi:hypothetical protein
MVKTKKPRLARDTDPDAVTPLTADQRAAHYRQQNGGALLLTPPQLQRLRRKQNRAKRQTL